MYKNWRDCEELKNDGFIINTTNIYACKLFDAALTQYISRYEEDELNGLYGTIKSMIDEDPNFLMGHVLNAAIKVLGSPENTEAYKQSLECLNNLRDDKKMNLCRLELMHVEAVNILALGDLPKACFFWETILMENPNDFLALKLLYDTYFNLGYFRQMRDTLSHVLPLCKKENPLFKYLYSMLAFGLSETNYVNKAEFFALKGLELNIHDAWATHVLCHVYDHYNRIDDGIEMLRKSESVWSECFLIAKHNYWHWCLYLIEKGEHDLALKIYDEHIYPYSLKLNSFVDACSVLYRLKLDGCQSIAPDDDKLNRWKNLKMQCLPLMNARRLTFNETHYFMSISACHDDEAKYDFFTLLNNQLIDRRKSYVVGIEEISDTKNYVKNIKKSIGVPLFKAIDSFDKCEFSKVVELLYPIRYNIENIGGSSLQCDVFHQMLAQAALRSDVELHNKIGMALLNERRLIKPRCNLTENIYKRFGKDFV